MKNVLISGGSRGIGAACVRLFSELGYGVYFLYKNSQIEAEQLAQETRAIPIRCDISRSEDIKKAYSAIADKCHIDILVNNAGISQIKMFQDISESDFDNMFNTNIRGMFMLTQAFSHDMINKKYGRIINISSMWGETGGSCEVHYSASKAAVIGFTKALAKELAPSGITVNCVSPGVIKTDMNSKLSPEDIAMLLEETPTGRIGTPYDVACAVRYFAEESGFVTGTILPVNGGIIM